MLDTETITKGLAQFSGSAEFYRHWTRKAIYTEGVRFLADSADCHWLLDSVVAHQGNPAVAAEAMQVWKLEVSPGDARAVLTCGDGTGHEVFRTRIDFTDFPLAGIEIWCLPNELGNRTILLPGEY